MCIRDRIKGDGYQHGPDELVPGALMSCGHCSRRIMRQVIFQELWQVPVCKTVDGIRQSYHIRSKESGDDRYCHYDRIKVFVHYIQTDS